MRVVVPFAAERPKTRLADVLEGPERAALARAMLGDVIEAVEAGGGRPEVLATGPVEVPVPVAVDERPLTPAVNAVLAAAELPVAVVMADLPLATAGSVERLLAMEGDVVIAPGRGGGTNGLVVRHPDFRVDYHGVSFSDHRAVAREIGARVEVVDSHRLASDVDTRADLVEVLVHGEGRAAAWLRDAGFELTDDGSRVGVRRG